MRFFSKLLSIFRKDTWVDPFNDMTFSHIPTRQYEQPTVVSLTEGEDGYTVPWAFGIEVVIKEM